MGFFVQSQGLGTVAEGAKRDREALFPSLPEYEGDDNTFLHGEKSTQKTRHKGQTPYGSATLVTPVTLQSGRLIAAPTAWPGPSAQIGTHTVFHLCVGAGSKPARIPRPRPSSPGESVQKGGPQPPFGLVVLRGDCQEGKIESPRLTVSFGPFLHRQKRTSPRPQKKGRIARAAGVPGNDRENPGRWGLPAYGRFLLTLRSLRDAVTAHRSAKKYRSAFGVACFFRLCDSLCRCSRLLRAVYSRFAPSATAHCSPLRRKCRWLCQPVFRSAWFAVRLLPGTGRCLLTLRLFATPGFPPTPGRPGPAHGRPWALPIRSGPSGLLTTAQRC